MQHTATVPLHHQNFMLAVRREMGWPTFRPANDCIAFCSGRTMDFVVGSEMARIAHTLRKDAIYTGWANTSTALPTNFAIIYRELLTVDIIDRVVPYAVNDDAPIVFVSARAKEFFAADLRGSLVRFPGKPKAIGAGRKLAMAFSLSAHCMPCARTVFANNSASSDRQCQRIGRSMFLGALPQIGREPNLPCDRLAGPVNEKIIRP